MLPVREVRDRTRARLPALVVGGLVAVNVLAFVLEQAMVAAGDRAFPFEWGLVPRLLAGDDFAHGALTVVTSMFLHAGWFHLLGNLWFLWVFGPSVEDALGHARFAALYLGGGLVAAASQVAFDPSSAAPMLGASGAIGAVLAAYVSLFPFRRVSTLVPILIVPLILPIPALVFVLEWFLLNLFHGLGALGFDDAARGGVAWWAHLGGFLSGLLLVRLLFPSRDDDADAEPGGPLHHGGDVVVRGADGRRLTTTRGGARDDGLQASAE
ncbi:MAG: rhomboid family intramembrane serine protease [Polyangiales bacterium]